MDKTSLIKELRSQQQIIANHVNTQQMYQQTMGEIDERLAYLKENHAVWASIFLSYFIMCLRATWFTNAGMINLSEIHSIKDLLKFILIFPFTPFTNANTGDYLWHIFGNVYPTDYFVFYLVRFIIYTILIYLVLHFIQKAKNTPEIEQLKHQLKNLENACVQESQATSNKLKNHPRFNLPNYEAWYLDRLIQILETGQAQDLGNAVKLLESQLRSEQLAKKLDESTAASQRAEQAARDAQQAANNAEQVARDAKQAAEDAELNSRFYDDY